MRCQIFYGLESKGCFSFQLLAVIGNDSANPFLFTVCENSQALGDRLLLRR
jgi:hypothetical protein